MSDVLLDAQSLMMSFGGVHAVRDVSLTLERGELRCIIGPNGAGKSTLFNMLAGTLRPLAGSIRFEGRDLVGLPVHRFAHAGIARKFQVPSLFQSMTVSDSLDVARRTRDTPAGQAKRIAETLDALGLMEVADVAAAELPHGRKQWLEIGMTLMMEPKLLLLDEPTAGMTPEETQKTAQLLTSLSGNMTIVVIEHDMHFVRALACPTLVMHQGQVIASGPFSAIENDATVRDVYLGRQ